VITVEIEPPLHASLALWGNGGRYSVHEVHCALDLVHPRGLMLPGPLCRNFYIFLVVKLEVVELCNIVRAEQQQSDEGQSDH